MNKNGLLFDKFYKQLLALAADFLAATAALLDRFCKSPYLLIKASNDFVIDQKGVIKITKKLLVSYLIIFLIFSGTGLFYLFNPFNRSAEAAWFNDNWQYRKAITLTVDSQSAARSNVYALLTLNTNLTSSKLQSACQDLRFTDISGNLLPYFIPNTSSCNTNSTNQIWVLLSSVPASSTSVVLYMYYGNPAAVAGSNVNQLPLINGLQGYWKLNESSGTAADSSVNTNTLTNNNTTTYTTGQFANAASFAAASSQSLSITDASQTGLDNMTELSISLWVNPTTLADGSYMVIKDTNNGTCSYSFAYDLNGTIVLNSCTNGFYGTGFSNIQSDPVVSTSTWTHIAIVSTAGTVRLYKNGAEISSGNYPYSGGNSTISNSSSPFSLGGGTSGGSTQYMDGKLDDVRVYNRALSASDVAALYNNPGEAYLSAASTEQTPSAASEELGSAPTLYWEFDQSQGTTAEDGSTNNLDGTLNNTPVWQPENMCVEANCLSFASTNQNVSLADNDKIDFVAADNFTTSAWVKRNGAASANTVIMQKSTANIGSTYTGYKLYMDASGDFCFDVQDGTNAVDSACTSAVDFDDDAWHFVQGVKSGTSSITLFVDGKQRARDASIASTGTLANASTYRVGIDSDGTSNDWLGFIDEVKITRDQTARTATQAAVDYNTKGDREGVSQQSGNYNLNSPSALSNSLVGYWKTDESSGNASDSSGNSLTLTNNNTATYTIGKFGRAGAFSAASSQYLSTATTISSVKTLSFWTFNSSTSDEYINLTASAYITSSSGTVSASGWTSPQIYVNNTLNGTLSASAWNHVVITSTTGINANQFEIGRANSAYNNGNLDEIRLYSRTLSASDISQLYKWSPGPLLYYPFDDGSGTAVVDKSTNGNNGTWNGTGNHWSPGRYGGAGNFTGTTGSDYVGGGSASSIDDIPSFGGMTVEFWIYQINGTSDSFYNIVNKDNNGANGWAVYSNNGTQELTFRIDLATTDIALQTGASPFANSSWAHVAATLNTSNTSAVAAAIYINGVLSTSTTAGVGAYVTDAARNLEIGRQNANSTNLMNGEIDDLKIYNYIKTPSQIQEDINAFHPAPGSPISNTVGWWKFNEGADNMCSGGTNDVCNSGSIGTTLDGTSTATRTNSGKVSRALDFDGSDDVVTITNSGSIDFDTGLSNFTFSAWVNADSDGEADTGQILNKGANTYLRVDSQDGSNNLDLECNLDRSTDTNVNIADAFKISTWSYVACSWDGNTLSVYVNGQLRGSSTAGSGAIATDTNNLLIGGGTSNNFDGRIDEFKVFNGALTPSQIALDANSASTQVLGATGNNTTAGNPNAASQEYCIPGDSSTCTSPVGRWDMNEGSWTNDCSTDTVFDTSGNNVNGDACPNSTGPTGGAIGKISKAGDFDGTEDYLSLGTGLYISGALTISTWIKIDTLNSTYRDIFTKMDNLGCESPYEFGVGSNNLFYIAWTGAGCAYESYDIAGFTPVVNTWYHLAVTRNSALDTVYFYVNGVRYNGTLTSSNVSITGVTNSPVSIGRAGAVTDQYFDGIIDQVKIFDYERTHAQIAYDYNRGAPVGYWKMDDCQGTTVNDSSGFSNTGTWSGSGGGNTAVGTCATSGTAWGDGVAGKRNYSLEFDGTDDVVNAGSGTMLDNLPANGMSLSLWIKPNGLGENSTAFIVDKNTGTSQNTGWIFHLTATNALVFAVDGSTDLVVQTANNVWTTSAWNHVSLSWNGTMTSAASVRIYINGKEVSYTTQTNGASRVDDASSSFYIGNDSTGARTFDGQIDDVKVFNYALTSSQITTLYNDGAVRYGPVTGAP